jgi:predicted metal-dependent hydrolase
MLEWLRADPRVTPTVDLDTRRLPIAIVRRTGARRMTLRLAPDGSEARVSIPRYARSADAIAFVRSRAGWLEAQLAELPVRTAVEHGATLPYRGEPLTISHTAAAPRRPLITGGTIQCGGAVDTLTGRLGRWLEGEARRLLADDLAHYCERASVALPALALSRAQRRWGSCAQHRKGEGGTIRINWRLVMAPDFVRRSVVAHEVAHLLHFDHSPRFHAALGALYEGDIAAANRWLKHHGRELYAPFG